MRTIIIILLVMAGSLLRAQDTHYWSQQYGTRSALMSGAVVGGAIDNSMIFYNPGALGFLEESNISVNANLYQITNVKVENALGETEDFTSSQVGTVPLLISGMLSKDGSDWKIGYALISPVNFVFKGTARLDDDLNIVDDGESPGAEEFIGEKSLDLKTTETMGGIAFSRKINDKLSVGFTNFFNFHSTNYNRSTLFYMYLNDSPGNSLVTGTAIENVNFWNLRYQLKVGAGWRMNTNWQLGMTVSLPSLNLFGQGTVAANLSAQNIKINNLPRLNIVASDRQEKLKTTYKSPFSVAIGANYSNERSKFGISMEYFAPVDEYYIMNAEPAAFIRPADIFKDFTSDEFLNIYTAASSVLNVAIGYERLISENLSLIGSMRTDFTYAEESDLAGFNVTVSNWDIWHVVAGANIMKERSTLTVGIMPSFGNNSRFEEDGTIGNETDLLGGATTITQANYFAIGFLLGYTYHFKKF